MDDMMRILSKLPNGTYIKIEWDSAMLALGGIIETIYQTDNGMPETVSGFQEYYAAAFRIKDVLKNESGRVLILDGGADTLSLDIAPATSFHASGVEITARNADKIIVLDDGQAVGIGTHAALLGTCPVYKEIFDSQFKKEGGETA